MRVQQQIKMQGRPDPADGAALLRGERGGAGGAVCVVVELQGAGNGCPPPRRPRGVLVLLAPPRPAPPLPLRPVPLAPPRLHRHRAHHMYVCMSPCFMSAYSSQPTCFEVELNYLFGSKFYFNLLQRI